jgi:hypothetical protein
MRIEMITSRTGRPPLSPEFGPRVRRSVILFQAHDLALRQASEATGIPVSELIRRAVESLFTIRQEAKVS